MLRDVITDAWFGPSRRGNMARRWRDRPVSENVERHPPPRSMWEHLNMQGPRNRTFDYEVENYSDWLDNTIPSGRYASDSVVWHYDPSVGGHYDPTGTRELSEDEYLRRARAREEEAGRIAMERRARVEARREQARLNRAANSGGNPRQGRDY